MRKLFKRLFLFISMAALLMAGTVSYNGNNYIEVTMPFTYTGATTNYFVTAGDITEVSSTQMATMNINSIDYSNQVVTTLPDPIRGMYFFDYTPKNKNGRLDIYGTTDWMDTVFVDTITTYGPYSFTGRAKQYIIADTTLTTLEFSNIDTLKINGVLTTTSPTYLDTSVRYNFYYVASDTTGSILMTFDDNALPITLENFYADIKHNAVILKWITASEVENSKFLIYRNGKVIGEVQGAGTSTETLRYDFIDEAPIIGTATYQISDISYSGVETMGPEIQVEYPLEKIEDIESIIAYPNPSNPTVSLKINSNINKTVPIMIYNLEGKLMLKQSIYLVNGINNITLPTEDFASGSYILKINFINTTRVTIKK